MSEVPSQASLNLHDFSPTVAYNHLPLLPPKDSVETLRTLKAAIGATRALAELRGVGGQIPNQALLLRAIVLQEAKLSSEIENIVTTNDKLYRAFSDDPERTDPNTKEVLRYQQALWHGYNEIKTNDRPLTTSLFVELVQIIKQAEIGIRRMSGTQIVNDRTGAVIYTPPDDEKVIRDLLDNLCEYLYAEDGVDPLIKLAVAHYQFEAIHPFSDGNGRTGRVLNILYLLDKEMLDIPVLYLSRFIIENKSAYYTGLRRVTEENAWEDWITYVLQAVEHTAGDAKDRIRKIRETLDDAIEHARTNMAKGYSKELIELVFQQPYIRIQFLKEAGIAGRQTSSAYLKDLERIGILRSLKFGREVLYVNHQLMQILSS